MWWVLIRSAEALLLSTHSMFSWRYKKNIWITYLYMELWMLWSYFDKFCLFLVTGNSVSSREYPRSETDSVNSDNSVESSQSGQQQTLTTFHPQETNHDRIGIRRRSPNRGSPQTCDQDTGNNQCENSVSSQTVDIIGRHGSPHDTCGVSNTSCNQENNYSVCANCGVEKPSQNKHSCRQNTPPSIPPKPSKLRQRRRSKEHSQFDSSQPPGGAMSDSEGKNIDLYYTW